MKRSIMCIVALILTICILIPANIITADASSSFYSSATIAPIKSHIEEDAGFSNYVTAQGSCTDGKYAYFAINNGYTTILKYDVNTWELKDRQSGLYLGHANDMTYNSKKDIIVVANNAPDYNILTFLDPDTLEIIGTKKIKYKIYSISYNSQTDQYVVGISGTYDFAILNSKFKKVERYDGYQSGYLRQGCDSDDDYIYFVQSGGGGNLIVIYNWNGELVDTVTVDKALEIENIFHVKNTVYITLHHFGNFVHRIGISDKTAIKYKVKFDPNGGNGEMKSITVTYGKKKKLPKCTFEKEGYHFGGWIIKRDSYKKYFGKKTPYSKNTFLKWGDVYDYALLSDETKVSKNTNVGDVTAIAFWIADEYRVYYDANGGEGYLPLRTVAYDETFKLDKSNMTKSGYVFLGWTAQRKYDDRIFGYAKKKDEPKWLDKEDVYKPYIFADEQEVSKLTYDLGVTFKAYWELAFKFTDKGKTLDQYVGVDKNVVFPETKIEVEKINDEAFANSKNMESITIPDSVETLGKNIFKGCENLSEIHFEEKLPQNVLKTTFDSEKVKKFYLSTEKEDIFLGWYMGEYSYQCMNNICNNYFY